MSGFEETQDKVLRALVEMSEAIGGLPWIPNGTLRRHLGMPHPSVLFLSAVESLVEVDYAKVSDWKGQNSRVQLTPDGLNFYNNGFKFGGSDEDNSFQDPIDGHIIKIDRSDSRVKEIEEGIEILLRKLQTGNDIGDLSSQDREVAVAEVGLLKKAWGGAWLRGEDFSRRAGSTLRWIGEKAASTAVGELAKHILAMILRFIF